MVNTNQRLVNVLLLLGELDEIINFTRPPEEEWPDQRDRLDYSRYLVPEFQATTSSDRVVRKSARRYRKSLGVFRRDPTSSQAEFQEFESQVLAFKREAWGILLVRPNWLMPERYDLTGKT